MKKNLLFAVAIFAAVSINAKEINIDLSNPSKMAYEGCDATFNFAGGELTVNYDVTGWAWAGIEIDLNNLTNVTSLSFELKGNPEGVGILHYLRDAQGNRWWDAEAWAGTTGTWETVDAIPSVALWDSPAYSFGNEAFTQVGFIANLSEGNGSFILRNVVISVSDATGIENVNAEAKATKVIRNGQVFFIRDGKTFNALGAIVAE